MRTFYLISTTIHVLAAMLWLGGMFFLGLIGAPVLRAVEPPALRQTLFNALGIRFRTIGWIAIAVLVVTGVANLHFRGWLQWDGVFGSTAFWSTAAGTTLALKLIAVVLMVLVSAIHDFLLGPAASRAETGTAEAMALRRRASWLGRVNVLVGLIVVIAAVRLARGG